MVLLFCYKGWSLKKISLNLKKNTYIILTFKDLEREMAKVNESLDKVLSQFRNKLSGKMANFGLRHEEVLDMLDLGDRVDDPLSVMLAADKLPSMMAFYSDLLSQAQEHLQKATTMYDVWKSKQEARAREIIFKNAIKKGMSPTNARPTESQLKDYFNNHIYNTEEEVKHREIVDKWKERVTTLRNMEKMLNVRKDTLVLISNILARLIQTGQLQIKDKAKLGKGYQLHKQIGSLDND